MSAVPHKVVGCTQCSVHVCVHVSVLLLLSGGEVWEANMEKVGGGCGGPCGGQQPCSGPSNSSRTPWCVCSSRTPWCVCSHIQTPAYSMQKRTIYCRLQYSCNVQLAECQLCEYVLTTEVDLVILNKSW